MTDDQHGENPPQAGGRWDPLPQGEYDDGATAFVKLPEGGVDALRASDSPLAAPGHGYVPPPLTASPAEVPGAGQAAVGGWSMPVDGAQWSDPNALPQEAGAGDRFTYHPAATQQWTYDAQAAQTAHDAQAVHDAHAAHDVQAVHDASVAHAPGQDVTGHWSIPVAGGDLPDESGEFTTSSLVEQWGGTPPATLPGGAPAPWATEFTGQPWGRQEAPTGQPTAPARADEQPGGAAPEAAPEGFLPASAYQDAPVVPGAPDPAVDGPTGPGPTGHALADHAPTDYNPVGHAPADHHLTTGHTPAGHDTAIRPDDGHTPAAGTVVAPPTAPVVGPPAGLLSTAAPAGPGADAYPAAPSLAVPVPPVEHAAAQALSGADERQVTREPTGTAGTNRPTGFVEAAEAAEAAGKPGDGAEEAPEGPAEPPAAAEATEDAPVGQDSAQAPTAGVGSDTVPDDTGQPGATEDTVPPPHDDHPLASYVLRVNGADRPVTDAWIGESLLYVLRERLGLAGAKDGCSQGECGACNVQVDGRLVASCLVPAVTSAGSEVRTVEGLAADGRPSDVQRALAECGAVQCGFCIPGMAMTVHDLLEGNPAPTELEARQALCGNLCRCSGYRGVLDAVRTVVAERGALRAADAEPETEGARIPHQAGPGAGGVRPPASAASSASTAASAFEAQGPPVPHDQQPYGRDGGQA